jgi:hypothetical protein
MFSWSLPLQTLVDSSKDCQVVYSDVEDLVTSCYPWLTLVKIPFLALPANVVTLVVSQAQPSF